MTTITTPSPRAIAVSAALTFALGLLAAPPPAAAAVTYTYTGTVESGFDETGVFNLAGQDLAGRGLTFTATFVREDLPGAGQYFDATTSRIAGFDANSPVLGTITINGRTHSIGSYIGQQSQQDDPEGCGPGCGNEQFDHNTQDRVDALDPVTGLKTYVNNDLSLGGFGLNTNFLASPDYHTLPSLSAADGVTFFGSVRLEDFVLGSDDQRLSHNYGFAHLTPTALTVFGFAEPVGGVPEPTAWALMILGFGGVGATLRGHRRWALLA